LEGQGFAFAVVFFADVLTAINEIQRGKRNGGFARRHKE
jgi:hypothetical protein